MRRLAPALLLSLAVPAAQEPEPDPVVYVGRAFVFRADLDEARARGWIGADADAEEVLERTRTALQDRLRVMGRFAESTVKREEGGRLVAIFVGDQPEGVEQMLVQGLANPGRLEFRVSAAEVPAADEVARLTAWRAAHPEASLAVFDRVAREEGGPPASIVWRTRRGSAEPVALERAFVHPVGRGDMAPGLRVAREVEPELALEFALAEARAERLTEQLAERERRTLVVLVNDVVVETREVTSPLAFPMSVGSGYPVEEVRALIVAIGNPVDTPLAFVERTERELDAVKRRDD
jgi:hypothetical protein